MAKMESSNCLERNDRQTASFMAKRSPQAFVFSYMAFFNMLGHLHAAREQYGTILKLPNIERFGATTHMKNFEHKASFDSSLRFTKKQFKTGKK